MEELYYWLLPVVTPSYMKFKSKKYSIDSTDYQVGQDNVSKWGMDIHSNVFSVSVGLSLLFIITLLALSPSEAKDAINTIKNAALTNFDYVFILAIIRLSTASETI